MKKKAMLSQPMAGLTEEHEIASKYGMEVIYG